MVFHKNSLKRNPRRWKTKEKWPSIKISSVLIQISFTYLAAAYHNNRSSEGEEKTITRVKHWIACWADEYPETVCYYTWVYLTECVLEDSRKNVLISSVYFQPPQAVQSGVVVQQGNVKNREMLLFISEVGKQQPKSTKACKVLQKSSDKYLLWAFSRNYIGYINTLLE